MNFIWKKNPNKNNVGGWYKVKLVEYFHQFYSSAVRESHCERFEQ